MVEENIIWGSGKIIENKRKNIIEQWASLNGEGSRLDENWVLEE